MLLLAMMLAAMMGCGGGYQPEGRHEVTGGSERMTRFINDIDYISGGDWRIAPGGQQLQYAAPPGVPDPVVNPGRTDSGPRHLGVNFSVEGSSQAYRGGLEIGALRDDVGVRFITDGSWDIATTRNDRYFMHNNIETVMSVSITYRDDRGRVRGVSAVDLHWYDRESTNINSVVLVWRFRNAGMAAAIRNILARRWALLGAETTVTLRQLPAVTPPAITGPATIRGQVGVALTPRTYRVNPIAGVQLRVGAPLISAAPRGINITPTSTGFTIDGTPTDTGSAAWNLIADNQVSDPVIYPVNITVTAAVAAAAPTITTVPRNRTLAQGDSVTSGMLIGWSAPAGLRSISVSGLPVALRFERARTGSFGNIRGDVRDSTPARDYTVRVRVVDNQGRSATRSFVITVEATAQPEVGVPADRDFDAGQQIRRIVRLSNVVSHTITGLQSWMSEVETDYGFRVDGRAPLYIGGETRDFPIVVNATGAGGRTARGEFNIGINPREEGPPPEITDITIPDQAADAEFDVTQYYRHGTIADGYPVVPDWVTVDTSTTGQVVYSGTVPSRALGGSAVITLRINGTPGASDDIGGRPRQATRAERFTILAAPVQTRPPRVNAPDRKFNAGVRITPFRPSAFPTDVVWEITGLPEGLTAGVDGTISGTPTTGGTYIYTATATRRGVSGSDNGTITVEGGGVVIPAPEVDTQGDVSLAADAELDLEIGYRNGTAAVAITGDSAWITAAADDGEITLTGRAPSANRQSVATVDITITGLDGRTAEESFTITVAALTPYTPPPTPVNNPPEITAPALVTLAQGADFPLTRQLVLRADDPDGDTIASFTRTGRLPTGMSAATAADNSAITLSPGVSLSAAIGDYAQALRAADSKGAAATAAMTIRVTRAGNNPPDIVGPGALSVDLGGAVSASWTASDPDAGDTVTFELRTRATQTAITAANAATHLPAGVTYAKSGNTITLGGAVRLTAISGGYEFTLVASDGELEDSLNFRLEVSSARATDVIPVLTGPANATFTRGDRQYVDIQVMNMPRGERWSIDAGTADLPGSGLQVTASTDFTSRYQAIVIGTNTTVTARRVYNLAITVTDAAGNQSLPHAISIVCQPNRGLAGPRFNYNLPSTLTERDSGSVDFQLLNPGEVGGVNAFGNANSGITLTAHQVLRSDIGGDYWPSPFHDGWATLRNQWFGRPIADPSAREVNYTATPRAVGESRVIIRAKSRDYGETDYQWIVNVREAANPGPTYNRVNDMLVVRGYTAAQQVRIRNSPASENVTVELRNSPSWVTTTILTQATTVASVATITAAPPETETPGTMYRCQFRATDAAGNSGDWERFTVEVDDLNPPPRILAPDNIIVRRGQELNYNIRVVNRPVGEVVALSQPAGEFANPSLTGVQANPVGNRFEFEGTVPATAAYQDYAYNLIAWDGVNAPVRQTVNLRVKSRPVIQRPADRIVRQGENIIPIPIEIIDEDGDPIRQENIRAFGLPAGLRVHGGMIIGTVAQHAPATGYTPVLAYFDGFFPADPVSFDITVAGDPLPPPVVPLISAQRATLRIDANYDGRYGAGENYSDKVLQAQYRAGITNAGDFFSIGADNTASFTMDNRGGEFTSALIGVSIEFIMAWSDPAFLDDFGGSVRTGVRFRGFINDVQWEVAKGYDTARLVCYGALGYLEATHREVSLPQEFTGGGDITITQGINQTFAALEGFALPIDAPRNRIGETVLTVNPEALVRERTFGTPEAPVQPYQVLKKMAQLDFGRIYTQVDGGVNFEGIEHRLRFDVRQPEYTLLESEETGTVRVKAVNTRLSRIVNKIETEFSRVRRDTTGNYIDVFNDGNDIEIRSLAGARDSTVSFDLTPVALTADGDQITMTRLLDNPPQWMEGVNFDVEHADGNSKTGNTYVTFSQSALAGGGIRITARFHIAAERGGAYVQHRALIRFFNVTYDQVFDRGPVQGVPVQASIARYGEHAARISSKAFVGRNEELLRNYLNNILQETAWPRTIYMVDIDGGAGPANKDFALGVEVGQAVQCYFPSVGLGDPGDYQLLWIERIEGKVEGPEHSIRLTLTEDYGDTWLRIIQRDAF